VKVIWKFDLDPFQGMVSMPEGAKILHVHEQAGRIRIWAEVDPALPSFKRQIEVVPTGSGRVPEKGLYIGTVHLRDSYAGAETMLVFHLYDRGEMGRTP
jgi:hypothetical protein